MPGRAENEIGAFKQQHNARRRKTVVRNTLTTKVSAHRNALLTGLCLSVSRSLLVGMMQ